MTDDRRISVAEAARRLQTTPPTVRSLLRGGLLDGVQTPRGSRFAWRVDEASLRQYEGRHGKFTQRRPQSVSARVDGLERRLAALEERNVVSREAGGASEGIRQERDDLRATVVTHREMLARTRTVADLQQRADSERAALVEHLLAAASAGERADGLRRAAVAELNEAVAAASRVGHPGELRADGETR